MFRDNEPEDYFNAPAGSEVPKAPKEPVLKPDDPRYYEKEDEWEHLRPAARNWKMWTLLVGCGMLVGILYSVYLYYLHPYSDMSVQYGYVGHIERRGDIFKTFEGVFLPYKSLADTIEPYSGDLRFSVRDDHVAAELLRLHKANMPARIELKTYRGSVPWRGESNVIITKADTADVSKIYPPVMNHSLIPAPHLENSNEKNH